MDSARVNVMQIRVLFFGILKDVTGRAEQHVRVEQGTNIRGLFAELLMQHPRLANHRASVMFSRNREFADDAARLEDGDEVALLPPVSGGTVAGNDIGAETIICRLTRDTIDVRALEAELFRPHHGAGVTFAGVVRNHSGGRETLYLEYEAYEPLALAKMREICAMLLAKYPIGGVGMIHRLGRLEIGEASVVIAVTSPHRRPAFDACREAIDELKSVVPIWKKECFRDGAVWVEGERPARSED